MTVLGAAAALLLLATACGGRPGPAAGTTPPPPTAAASGTPPRTEKARAGFVVIGDFGTGGAAQRAVARAMRTWERSGHRVDALVTTGDNVYPDGSPRLFASRLDEPYRPLRRPTWITLGNHDVQNGHGQAELRHLGLPDLPYAKQLPGAQILFLDADHVDAAQTRWLERRLSAAGPPVRVVVFHQPAWSCSRHGSTPAVDARWVPVLERHRVTLVLNGHDHNYQRFTSAHGVTYIVTGGGGASLYPVASGCRTPPRAAAASHHHFTAVEVTAAHVTVTAVRDDGAVLDRVVLPVPRPSGLPPQ
ncbi:metallophosphoesterase family protein [Streptomyces sediminimaris]|uniref:metallophosphoesterase family protein n=1 Tax=Streptomyces sediminimaris TaxID=3383721 RepID=UPI00399A4AC7